MNRKVLIDNSRKKIEELELEKCSCDTCFKASNSSPAYSQTQSNSYHNTQVSPLYLDSLYKQTQLDDRRFLSKSQQRLEHLADRIQDCNFMEWAHLCCENCGNIVKNRAVKLSCLSAFCQNPECIRNRKRLVRNYLRDLKIKSKSLYHFVIGFRPVKKITKELRAKYRVILKSIIRDVEKTHPKLHLIIVGDINRAETGLRYHFHIGSLPVKDFRMLSVVLRKSCESVSECFKTSVGVQLIGYSRKSAIYSYFSKRASGVFGHERDFSNFGYPDVMKLKDYFEVFYRTKKIFLHHLKCRHGVTEFIDLLDNLPEKCPYCSHKKFRIIPENIFKPPPDLTCFECGLSVDARDWDYSRGCCRMCGYHKSPEHKAKLFEQEFKKFLDGKVNPFPLNQSNELSPGRFDCESRKGSLVADQLISLPVKKYINIKNN